MNPNLKENERLDSLQRNGYQIIQNPEKFCFGMDAVLLSGFARAKEGDRVLIPAYGYMEAKFDGETYIIMRQDEIFAIITE